MRGKSSKEMNKKEPKNGRDVKKSSTVVEFSEDDEVLNMDVDDGEFPDEVSQENESQLSQSESEGEEGEEDREIREVNVHSTVHVPSSNNMTLNNNREDEVRPGTSGYQSDRIDYGNDTPRKRSYVNSHSDDEDFDQEEIKHMKKFAKVFAK